jgi:ankyrin repeat protein
VPESEDRIGASVATTETGYVDELHKAVRDGDTTRVDQLLSLDRSLVDTRDPEGYTLLHNALALGHTELAQMLIDRGADVNASQDGSTPLHRAVAGLSKTDVVRLILRYDVDVNAATDWGVTPLHMAVNSAMLNMEFFPDVDGHDEVVRLLLSRGADPRAADHNGQTPLNLAEGNPLLVQLLAEPASPGESSGASDAGD